MVTIYIPVWSIGDQSSQNSFIPVYTRFCRYEQINTFVILPKKKKSSPESRLRWYTDIVVFRNKHVNNTILFETVTIQHAVKIADIVSSKVV